MDYVFSCGNPVGCTDNSHTAYNFKALFLHFIDCFALDKHNVCLLWLSGWPMWLWLLVTHVSTTWAVVIFRVKSLDYRSGSWNVSHQQQSFWWLPSPDNHTRQKLTILGSNPLPTYVQSLIYCKNSLRLHMIKTCILNFFSAQKMQVFLHL